MFTKKRKAGVARALPTEARRGRGRPRGPTEQGAQARQDLYKTAIKLIVARGYEATTLREIARRAGVSVGLLYRYFPSKRAVVLALYDELSAEYAARGAKMGPGPWRERFVFALEASLGVLGRQRKTLAALLPVLVGDAHEGLFAPATAFSRQRVLAVFQEAVAGASDAPGLEDGAVLGRMLYLVHLAIILWWLLDKSPDQRATRELVTMLERVLPVAALALRLEPARGWLRTADRRYRDGLIGDGATPSSTAGEP
jgi:AcrR family transcriptional regulator